MTSDKKIRANQKNAQASTGPDNTDETRYNGTWHGFRGSRVVLSTESMDEYNAMAKTMYTQFEPEGTYEHNLVKRIADRSWELERAVSMKARAIDNAEYRNTLENELRVLEKYEASIERSLIRNRRELTQVQQLRGKTFSPGSGGTPPKPESILFRTMHYKGPDAEHLPTEGEVAVENLLHLAKERYRYISAPSGQTLFGAYIEKRADIALSNEASPPTPEEESDNDSPPGDGKRRAS